MLEQMYLIRKHGGYYRPNASGYTRNKEDAGRYTLAEAIRHSHPNGPDGPRDGMDYIPSPEGPGEYHLDVALARRRALRPIYRAAAEARISADWARRGDEARAYRERMGYDTQG